MMQTVINILMISLVTVFLGSCSDTTFEPETPAKMLENRSPDGNIETVMDTSSDQSSFEDVDTSTSPDGNIKTVMDTSSDQSNFEDVDTSTLVINILSLSDTSVELSWTPLEGNGELVDYFLFSSKDPLDFPSDMNSFNDNVGFHRETISKQAQAKAENLDPDTVIYFYVYAEKNNIRLPYRRLQTRTLTATDTGDTGDEITTIASICHRHQRPWSCAGQTDPDDHLTSICEWDAHNLFCCYGSCAMQQYDLDSDSSCNQINRKYYCQKAPECHWYQTVLDDGTVDRKCVPAPT